MAGFVGIRTLEAKAKRDARPLFEICEWKIGGGFYVRFILPNSAPEQIQGFASEAEAARWIRNESANWLRERRAAVGHGG